MEKETVSDWQPIETAPRDGTDILGYSTEEDDDLNPQIIKWKDGGWVISWDHTHMTGMKYYNLPDGRIIYTGHGQLPTHWMPLPEPPS